MFLPLSSTPFELNTRSPMGNTARAMRATRNRRSRRGTYWSTGSRAHDHWPGREQTTKSSTVKVRKKFEATGLRWQSESREAHGPARSTSSQGQHMLVSTRVFGGFSAKPPPSP